MNITETVAKIKEKDGNAQMEFYKETYKVAYSIAFNMIKNEDDVMDILQDAYITAYNKIGDINDPEKAVSWFNMIVSNKCKDYLKKKKPTLFNEMNKEEVEFEETLENENNEFVPEEAIDYSETKKLMMGILDELPEDQKLCVLMYYYEDLTVKEIAESLECTENTVKSRLNYGRKKIKEGVLDLEKKGTKLYGAAPMPFIAWMFKSGEEAYAATDVLFAKITAELQIVNAATGSVTAAATSAGTKAAATAAAVAGKGLATKVVAVVVAAGLALGGGIYAGKVANNSADDRNEHVKVELTAEEKEEAIINSIDEEYLKQILMCSQTYDEADPMTEEKMYRFILSSMYAMSLGWYDDTILNEEDVERYENDEYWNGDEVYGYIRVDSNKFDNAARILSFNGEINEELISSISETEENPSLEWDNGTIKHLIYSPFGDEVDNEIEIEEIRKVDGMVELDYNFIVTYAFDGQSEVLQSRTASLEYTEDGYVITKIVER